MSDQAQAASADATPLDAAPAAQPGLWQRLGRGLGAGLGLLLGSWTAPPWLTWLGRVLARAGAAMRARPGNTLWVPAATTATPGGAPNPSRWR